MGQVISFNAFKVSRNTEEMRQIALMKQAIAEKQCQRARSPDYLDRERLTIEIGELQIEVVNRLDKLGVVL